MTTLVEVLDDLREEGNGLDRLVAGLPADRWTLPTAAPGWTLAHQIAHLSWTDGYLVLALTEPTAFRDRLSALLAGGTDFVDRGARETLAAPAELLERWRDSRDRVARALAGAPPGSRHPWFGPDMSALSSATARLMETWAHGEDIAGALGAPRQPSARLRHVAFLGWRTFAHSFRSHGRPVPPTEVYVELTAPDGGTWAYGPPDAPDRVTGPALDFCLLVTQRVHPADMALRASGEAARQWLAVAQAFAGPPGPGRAPRHPVAG